MRTANIDNLVGSYTTQFQTHLERRFHQPTTIAQYGQCLTALGDQMKAANLEPEDLDEDAAGELIAKAKLPPYRSRHNRFIVRSFVTFLHTLGGGTSPAVMTTDDSARAELRRNYEAYLRRQRGLSERTIFHSWRLADRFLTFRFGEGDPDLSAVTAVDIATFLQHAMSRRPPLRDQTLSSHLRNFFRYLFKAGKTATNLATGILSVAQRHGARLPRHLAPEQVEMLLNPIRADTSSGRRNYAMVLLIARLGLRAPDVITIQIDDIDWRAAEIVVRGKGKRHDRVPLPPDVGEALTDYIKQDRKTTSRALFVIARPPHPPFKDSQVLNCILRSAFAKTGLKPPAPYVGSRARISSGTVWRRIWSSKVLRLKRSATCFATAHAPPR